MNALVDELPFWHFDDHLMVFKDGSLGAGFKLGGFDLSCATDDELGDLSRKLENLILSTSEGIRLQVYYDLNSDVSDLIARHKNQIATDLTLYKPVAEARLNFLEERAKEKRYFVPNVYVFVRSLPARLAKKRLFEKTEPFKSMSHSKYSVHKEKFLRSVKELESSLAGCSLSPSMIARDDWFKLIFEKLNPGRSEKIGSASLRPHLDAALGRQLCLSDGFLSKSGFELDDLKYRVVSLATLPEGFSYPAMIDALTRLPFHFTLVQNLDILEQAKERSKLELKRRMAHSMASGSQNVSDLDSESKLEQLENLLSELAGGSTKLVSMDVSVLVSASSNDELDEKCDEVLRALRGLNQAEGLVETLATREAFFSSLAGVCAGLRHHTVKSSNASHLMPVYRSWRGNKSPVCLIQNRDGDIFSFDPFSEELPNWNGIVFGGSGSGKSFTVAQLMLMFHGSKRRPRIFWIDNGASSKRLVENLGGEFIDLKIDAGISINMFDLASGETEPSPEKVKLILAVLELILKEDDQRGLAKRTKALLEEAIYRLYEKTKKGWPLLSDLRQLLAGHEEEKMRDLSEILYSWTGETAFGRILDRPTSVKFSKYLVTLEVQSLNAYGELKNVVMLLLTSQINDLARDDITKEYQLVIDEAERLLSGDSGKLARDFVVTCYRTWRKFRSSIVCLSQNYLDFMADKDLRDSLMPNTTNLIILRQRKIDWEDFGRTFDFNEAQVSAIKSLEIAKGRYSEFYLLQDERQAILRLEPEPLSYWLCTSDGADKAKISELKERFPEKTEMEILEHLAFNGRDDAA